MVDSYNKISVIMPAYNAETYIAESINSVLEQTYQNLELIIVDDGSVDHTLDVINSCSDFRVKVFTLGNSGQCTALNYGIRQSTGEYIKFLDADDVINAEHLLRQYESIKDNPGCIASCQWAYFVDTPDKITFEEETTHKDYDSPVEWIYDSMTYDKGTMGGWMWLIPRPVLEKAGHWDERLSLNNDFDFSIRLLLASEGVKFASEAQLYYRKGVQGALSVNFSNKAVESAYLTTCLGRDNLLKREDSPRIRRLLANRFQEWVYEIYPKNRELAKKFDNSVKELGGSKEKPQGGLVFKILNLFLPWEIIRDFQNRIHKTMFWKSVLRRKEDKRLEKLSGGKGGDNGRR